MLLSDQALRVIGRVAVLAGRLEPDQSSLTASLIGPDPEVRDVLAAPAENFGRLQDIARRLVVSRFAGHRFRDENSLKGRIDSWMHDAKVLMEQRNDVMHGVWGIGSTGELGSLTKRKPHVEKTMNADDLSALGDRIEALSDLSRELIRDVEDAAMSRVRYLLSVIDQPPGT
jgi:hypothetical protein